jgi:hypothetical protein
MVVQLNNHPSLWRLLKPNGNRLASSGVFLMPFYAQINGLNVVTGVSELHSVVSAPELIPIESLDSSLLGATYSEGVFTPAAPVSEVYTKLSKLAFRDRFTSAEKTALELASLDNPAATMEVRAGSAALRVYKEDVASAKYIDPKLPNTRNGVLALESFALIAAGRALEILDAPIQAHERYTE